MITRFSTREGSESMERLTYRDKKGKAYTKIQTGLTFIEEGEMVINDIHKLAY